MNRIVDPSQLNPAPISSPQEPGRLGKRSIETAPGLPRLDRIKGTEPPKGNFLTRAFESGQTRMTRAGRSVHQHAGQLLGTLDRAPGKALDSKKLLGEIVTLRKHFSYMAEVSGKPVDPTITLQLALAGRLSEMDNLQAMNLHRTFLSEDTTRLRSALEAEIRRNPDNREAKQCLEDLGVIEVTLLREISGRIARSDSPTPIPPLQERLTARSGTPEHASYIVPHDSPSASPAGKLSDKALEVLVESGGRSAALHERKLGDDAQRRLERKGVELSPRQVGDVMRKSDLTMNFNLADFFGIGRTVKPIDDCQSMRNMFQWGAQPDANAGALKRDMTERQFFESLSRSELDPDSRPTYGALDVGRQSKGGADFYGTSYFVLKPEVKQRCTFTIDDTFNVPHCKATRENLEALGTKLAGPASPLSANGREFFTRANGENLKILLKGLEDRREFTTTNLSQSIMGLFGGGVGLSADDIDQVAIQIQSTLFDEHATHAQITGYDNMEDLLSHLDESRLNAMMTAVESPAKGNFRLGNYIEAQIHGPVVFGEDVSALRVSLGDLEEVARKSQGAYTVETARAKLEAFCRDKGIELSAYDESDGKIVNEMLSNLESTKAFEQAHFDPEIRARQQHETQTALHAFIDDANSGPDGLASTLAATCTRLGIDVAGLNATNIARLKQEIVGAVENASEKGMKEVSSRRVQEITRQVIDKFVQTKADLLASVARMPIGEENRAVLRSFVLGSSTLTKTQMLEAVAQSASVSSGMLRMFADLPNLMDATRLDSVVGTLREFVADTRAHLDVVFKGLGKEWGRDDLMLYTERALSLGISMARIDKTALGTLYAQLISPKGQELIESLRVRSPEAENTRQNMADALHLLTVMVGREIGKSRPEVETDMRHAFDYGSMQAIPHEFRQSFKNLGLA